MSLASVRKSEYEKANVTVKVTELNCSISITYLFIVTFFWGKRKKSI